MTPKRWRAWWLTVAVYGAFFLVACSDSPDSESDVIPNPGYVDEISYDLEDGRAVTCLLFSHGLSCDWERAK